MNCTVPINNAVFPAPVHIDAISQVLEETLGTLIDASEIPRKEKNDESSVYWWRTASAEIIRGKAAFQYVQLQIVFTPATSKMQIDFLCLPDGQKGKGKGQIIMGVIKEVGRQLGYKTIYIESIEGSFNFWLKVGFKQIDPGRTSYPRPMTYNLR